MSFACHTTDGVITRPRKNIDESIGPCVLDHFEPHDGATWHATTLNEQSYIITRASKRDRSLSCTRWNVAFVYFRFIAGQGAATLSLLSVSWRCVCVVQWHSQSVRAGISEEANGTIILLEVRLGGERVSRASEDVDWSFLGGRIRLWCVIIMWQVRFVVFWVLEIRRDENWEMHCGA